MKPHPSCSLCTVHWVFERGLTQRKTSTDTIALVRGIIAASLKNFSPTANVGFLCNLTVSAVSDILTSGKGHYERLKERSNKNAAKLLPLAEEYVRSAPTVSQRFNRACVLAAAANVAPLNPPAGAYGFQEMRDVMEGMGEPPKISGGVYRAASRARNILYVTDNAGEIGFDSIVIRLLKEAGANVTLVVKSATFFEDATLTDAQFFSLDHLCDRIVETEGFLVPGKVVPAAAKALRESDLVIAKGTGSYEALRGEVKGKPSIFMLKVKCAPIAQEIGIQERTVVVKLDRT